MSERIHDVSERTSSRRGGQATATAPLFRRITDNIMEAFRSGEPGTVREFESERFLWIGIYPIRAAEGRVDKCFIVIQDITPELESQKGHQEQEKLWDITSESCRLGLWKLDLNTRILQTTPELDRIYGYLPNTIKWDLPLFLNMIVEEDRQRVESYVLDCIGTGQDGHFECRIRRVDGAIRYLSVVGKMQYDEHGEATRIFGFTQDITEQAQMEERHREEQLQWEQTARQCNLSIWKLDLETGRVIHKPEDARLFGKLSDELEWSASTFINKAIPEDRQRIAEIYERSLQTHRDVNYDCRVLNDDGQIRWINLFGSYQFDAKGNATSIVGAIADITERKLEEEKHREAQLQWDITARLCRIGMWRLDLETGHVTRGAEHAEIFGELPDNLEWSVNMFLDRVLPDDRVMAANLYQQAMKTHQDINFDCRIRRKDGQIRWLNVIGVFQFNEQGQATSVVGTTTDITEKKNLEINQQQLEEQLLQSQKMEVLGQLAGGIAHDFNNVLAAIQGNTELVLKNLAPTNPKYQNLVAIAHAVDRSAEMVRQLLAFARKQPICPKVVELDLELEKIFLLLRKMIRENISLRWQLNSPGACVMLDPANLDQIVTNLCVNARDAIEGHGRITLNTSIVNAETCGELERVACNPVGEYVRIRISDTGSGISAEAFPHIFDPFYTTKEVGEGSGLGLAMVYGLVKQNKGHIAVETHPGKGTTFDLFFPIVPSTAPQADAKTPEIATAATPEKTSVLIVEDEPDILKIMTLTLKQEGFNVLSADNAEDAIELAREQAEKITLTVSDIILPGMNGIDMSKMLLIMNPRMKFLFMSGYSADTLEEYGKFSEESNFISKPFSLIRFLNMIQIVLKEP